MAQNWGVGVQGVTGSPWCGCRPLGGTMGTTMGSASILEVCNTKLMEFMCNVDNKDMVWLQEIKEEALNMFSSDFSVEPELMPKTPSQRNRRRKKRFSSIEDENKPPGRKRLSRRMSRRSTQHSRQLLRSKEKLEKLVLVVAENGSIPRGTQSQAAAVPSLPASPMVFPKMSGSLPSSGKLIPIVEIGVSEQQSAEKCLVASKARTTDQKLSFVYASDCKDESMPKKEADSLHKPASGTSSVVPSEMPEVKDERPAQSVAKLGIAQPVSPEDAAPVVTEPGGAPSSPGTQPQPETELLLDLPESPRTPTGSRCDRRSVRRSLVRKSSQAHRVSLIHKYSMVPKKVNKGRRSSRKVAQEPAATGRIICHSYLERLLDVEVPRKASSEEESDHATESKQEAPEGTRRTLRPRNAHKIAISTPKTQPESGSQADSDSESKKDQGEEPREPPQSIRRKRSYKQAVSEPGENGDHMDDEALTPPRTKTPSPVCPPSKVVRPLRTFLHTVQKNQMLMTPTSTGRTSVMKSFIKRNTPHHLDAKEKERQRLENLKKKEEAELLRKQKVEEDKRRRLEEVKMKREERLRKVLQARERAEQLEVEKKKRIEQKLAQLEAKEERLAEEKARKKAAKKLEEAEMRRKQEEEARRQKRLQQEEEERRYQEQLLKKKEEEQERLRKVAEARRIAEQQKQRELQLVLEREMERKREQERLHAERERALQLQKERLQRELEEKRKREECQRQEQERKKLQEEKEKKVKEAKAAAAAAGAADRLLNVTVDVQSPVCNSYEMTPQGPKGGPKINPDNYGMDLNSDDSTDDETQPRKPIPAWATGTQLTQAVIRQYYQPPDIDQLFGTILSPKLEDIFNKSKPRYHKRTSSAVWHSPPLPGSRPFVGLSYGLKKP
ncbi:inner centromere protein isoform X3 [Notamacropus eugenii]|uniref:inner centromere protein isoform X3 n=1 Tax=Notamacropus eugenii TaxID=9315 RepID=UPI003B6712CB